MRMLLLLLLVLVSASDCWAGSICSFEVYCENVEYLRVVTGPMSVNPHDLADLRRKTVFAGYIYLVESAYPVRTWIYENCDEPEVAVMVKGRVIEKYPSSGVPVGRGIIAFYRDTEEEVRDLLNAICPEKILPGVYR